MVSLARARPSTPGKSTRPEDGPAPPVPEGPPMFPPPQPAQRRTSFNFLRRSKSGETLSRRSASGSKIVKKQQVSQQQEQMRRQQEAAAKTPPALPMLPLLRSPPPMNTFGGENGSATPPRQALRVPTMSFFKGGPYTDPPTAPPSVPIPPIPDTDPRVRSESMTHRGRYSYASSVVSTVNGPRRVRRRKDPTPYNILVVGAKSSGKTAFLNFLRTSLARPSKKKRGHVSTLQETEGERGAGQVKRPASAHPAFSSHFLETEIDGERVGLTLWDSDGLEKGIVGLQLRELNSFLESKFAETLSEEMKVVRSPGIQDTHIHCVFFLLDPARLDANIAAARKRFRAPQPNGVNGVGAQALPVVGGLDDDFDLQVLRALQGKTTVVPVVSKADTITMPHMAFLKRAVWTSVKNARLNLLEALGVDDSDVDAGDSTDAADTGPGARTDENDNDNDAASNGGDDDRSSASVLIRQSNVDVDADTTDENQPPPGSAQSSPATDKAQPKKIKKKGSAVSDSFSRPMPTPSASATPLPLLPLSIISPDEYEIEEGFMGRRFAWGVADPHDGEHCDFVKLKEAVFADWRRDLRDASKDMWYERWRTERLRRNAKA